MAKKLLVIGGRKQQLQLVVVAKREGYCVVVCHDHKSGLPIKMADRYYLVNCLDREKIVEIARTEKPDGVISNVDQFMPIVAYVAEKIGLIGNPLSAIEAVQSKAKFRDMQMAAGLYTPKHLVVGDEAEFHDKVKTIPLPLIIKPVLSAGSQGVTRFDEYDPAAMLDAFRRCAMLSRNGQVAIEQFVEMTSLVNIQCEVFVAGDEFLWDGFFTTRRCGFNSLLPMTHSYPSELQEEIIARIKNDIVRLFKCAGIVHGEFNVESYFTKEGDYFIIEVNTRQGGNDIPDCVYTSSGIDYTRLLVTTCVGDNQYLRSLSGCNRITRYVVRHKIFCAHPGTVLGIEMSSALPGRIIRKEIMVGKWGEVRPAQVNTDGIAAVVVECETREDFLKIRYDMESYVHPVVVPRTIWHRVLFGIRRLLNKKRILKICFEGKRKTLSQVT